MSTTNFMTITIDGTDVTKYSEYYVLNHLTKKTEPKRSDDFSLSNINEIEQVEIPEIHITFKYIPLEIYRKIFSSTRKAEFLVEYYDQDYDCIRKNMFYMKESGSLNPHAFGGKYYGFKDFKLNLVCTMNPINNIILFIEGVTKPYKISIPFGNITQSININTFNENYSNRISTKINVTFSNDEIILTGGDVEKNGDNIYVLTTPLTGSSASFISISNLKFKGEYVMYLSINDETYGSLTTSVIIEVV